MDRPLRISSVPSRSDGRRNAPSSALWARGIYSVVIRRALRALSIRPGERILLPVVECRLAVQLARAAGPRGKIVCVSQDPAILSGLASRSRTWPAILPLEGQMEDLPVLEGGFDRVVLVFRLHALEHHRRILALQSLAGLLRESGELDLLDWSEGDPSALSAPARGLFRRLGGDRAEDFMARDWKSILADYRIHRFQETCFAFGGFRLLRGHRY